MNEEPHPESPERRFLSFTLSTWLLAALVAIAALILIMVIH